MFLNSIIKRISDSFSPELEDSEHNNARSLLNSSVDEELQSGRMTDQSITELKKSKLRRISVILTVSFLSIIILSVLTYFLLQAISLAVILLEYEKLTCAETDLACRSLLCPAGMSWDPRSAFCLVEEDLQCCTTSNMTRTCYDPLVTTSSLQDCLYTKLGGAGPFLKVYCRPGMVWVEWLGQCLSSSGRG